MSEAQQPKRAPADPLVRARELALGGMYLALGVLVPFVFHVAGGPGIGKMLLPMHLPVLMAGLTLSPGVAAAVGFLAPLASGLLTPMPPLPIALLMAPELAALGGVAALVYRRVSSRRSGIIVATIAAMLADRLALSLWFLIVGSALGLEMAWHKYVAAAVTIGAPGIALQLAVVPATVKAIEKIGVTR